MALKHLFGIWLEDRNLQKKTIIPLALVSQEQKKNVKPHTHWNWKEDKNEQKTKTELKSEKWKPKKLIFFFFGFFISTGIWNKKNKNNQKHISTK